MFLFGGRTSFYARLGLVLGLGFVGLSRPLVAQILVEDLGSQGGASVQRKPVVGRGAAVDYFKAREKRSVRDDEATRTPDATGGDRVLMLHLGTFINDKAYRWGQHKRVDDPGESMLGVTYRVGEWKGSMDLYIRAELISYEIDDEKPLKLSFMPIIAFPDVRSDFPIYFGAGAGAGVFFKQAGDESDLSFDYALVVGARFPEIWGSTGVFIETGLKGQVHLLSSGQHEGVHLAVGGIFNF